MAKVRRDLHRARKWTVICCSSHRGVWDHYGVLSCRIVSADANRRGNIYEYNLNIIVVVRAGIMIHYYCDACCGSTSHEFGFRRTCFLRWHEMIIIYLYAFYTYTSRQSILSPNLHIAHQLYLHSNLRRHCARFVIIMLSVSDCRRARDDNIIPLTREMCLHNMMHLCPAQYLLITVPTVFFTKKQSLSRSRCSTSYIFIHTTPHCIFPFLKRSSIIWYILLKYI